MSNHIKNIKKMGLVVLLGLGLTGVAQATWQSDCSSIKEQTSNVKGAADPCATIGAEISGLKNYVTPSPFISTKINEFPDGVFPGGSPWSSSTTATAGNSSGSSSVMPSDTGTDQYQSSSSGGTFQ